MEGADSETQRDLKDYLEKHKIHDLFVKIVEELLKSKPENPLQKIAEFLSSEYGVRAQASETDSQPREEVIETYSESDSDSDDEEEDVSEMVSLPATKKPAGRRTSVSAGVISYQNVAEIKAPVFDKSAEEQEEIMAALRQNALFKECDRFQLETIVLAFEKSSFGDGEILIKEGDLEAEHFFLIQSGSAEALKGDEVVKSYDAGGSFGELALLYNQPRAATVRATSELSAWRLDQQTFKRIIVGGVIAKREKYMEFLKRCSLMQALSDLELMTLADSLEKREYTAGETIINQGDVGQDFFIVESGVVSCVKDGKPVLDLESGGYFGEIALLYNQPRQASVSVKGDNASVLAIDRKTFQRLMGPLGEILRRNPLHQEYLGLANK